MSFTVGKNFTLCEDNGSLWWKCTPTYKKKTTEDKHKRRHTARVVSPE